MLPYRQSGKGPVIVLLHGFCENKTCFNEQVLLLQDHYTVLAPDLPGFGETPAEEGISMERMADRVAEWLSALQITESIVIGHSMGGYVALAFAKKYASRIKGFGLLHSTALADTDERKQKRDQAIRFIEEHGSEPYIKNFIPPLFAPGYTNSTRMEELVQEGLKIPSEGLIYALRAMKQREDSLAFIASTDLPVLFIAGKLDAIIPIADNIKQAATGKQTQLVVLKHSAHMGYIEEADACAKGILDFASYCFGIS